MDAPVSLKLVAMCTVVRSELGAIALAGLKITRHEFLTTVLEK
jgi:hypothetical protein